MSESNPFRLKSSDQDFIQRQKNVFDQLTTLKTNLDNNSTSEMDVCERQGSRRSTHKSIMKQFRGKESIFKRPQDPITKNYMRNIPDFKKNPHKWVKYSLDDVKDEDMSDRSNTKAAITFLSELKDRKKQLEKMDDGEPEVQKIIFKKVTKNVPTSVVGSKEDESKPSFRSSKLVMPEYVVGGQKVRKEKKNRDIKSSSSQLKLDHLLDDEI